MSIKKGNSPHGLHGNRFENMNSVISWYAETSGSKEEQMQGREKKRNKSQPSFQELLWRIVLHVDCRRHPHPSPSRCIKVSLHKGKTRPTEQDLKQEKISKNEITASNKQVGSCEVKVTVSPIYRTEIHPQHHALLCILATVGWDDHHVTGHLRTSAFQPDSLNKAEKVIILAVPTKRSNPDYLYICVPTNLMLSSGLRSVNIVWRCCWMSPVT